MNSIDRSLHPNQVMITDKETGKGGISCLCCYRLSDILMDGELCPECFDIVEEAKMRREEEGYV